MSAVKVYDVLRLGRDPQSTEATDVRQDFELREVSSAASLTDLDNPRLSLYSLDLEHDTVAFVEGEEPAVLSGEPFWYMAQRRRAERVLIVDVETFSRLDRDLAIPPRQLLHLYSVGRCGSTLLHHALNQVRGVRCLSEPDVLFQIALARKHERLSAGRAVDLARASLRRLWREQGPQCTLLAVKHRGRGIWAFDEFRQACPGARTAFLYRNAPDTVESFDRVSGGAQGRRQWLLDVPVLSRAFRWWMRHQAERSGVDCYREHLSAGCPADVVERCGPAGYLLLDWISKVDCYLRLHALEPESVALRFEDMIAAPAASLGRLFEAVGLNPGDADSASAVFGRDSQEGTALGRSRAPSRPLSGTTIREIQAVIQRQTGLPPDGLLPGTLTPGAAESR